MNRSVDTQVELRSVAAEANGTRAAVPYARPTPRSGLARQDDQRRRLIIHARLLKDRPDLNSTLHTYTVSGMGVAAHKFGLLPISQHALRFYGEMKYQESEGFEFDHDMTPKLLQRPRRWLLHDPALSRLPGLWRKRRRMRRQSSPARNACQGQIAALSAGEGNYTIPSKQACEYAQGMPVNFLKGGKDWAACLRLAEQLDPSYKD
jgi:hypothetical protein